MDFIGWVVSAVAIEFVIGVLIGCVVHRKRKVAVKPKWAGRRNESGATVSQWEGRRALGE
jgi:uncharacterized membrane-anchored protein YhcB (DUF1043 family)